MSRMIKVYQFYIHDDAINNEYYSDFIRTFGTKVRDGEDIYHLYAWCTEKSTKKLFKLYRNMDIFEMITDEMTEDEFNTFRKKYVDFSVGIRDLFAKFVNKFTLACTNFEMETIYGEYDGLYNKFAEMADDRFFSLIFDSVKKEFRHALLNSGFPDFIEAKIMDCRGEPLAMEMDELSVLLNYYGNTFREKG